MTEVTTKPKSMRDNGARAKETLSARLETVGDKHLNQRVVVATAWETDNEDFVGRHGLLFRVDANDADLTYGVTFDNWEGVNRNQIADSGSGKYVWVHDVDLEVAEPQTTADSGNIEVLRLNARIADLINQATAADSRAGDSDRKLRQFKELVVKVAVDAKNEHGWCEAIDSIVRDELGLEMPDKRVSFTVTIEVQVTATCTSDHDPTDRSFVRDSIEIGSDGSVTMDSDWDDVSIDDSSISSVSDVETVDN